MPEQQYLALFYFNFFIDWRKNNGILVGAFLFIYNIFPPRRTTFPSTLNFHIRFANESIEINPSYNYANRVNSSTGCSSSYVSTGWFINAVVRNILPRMFFFDHIILEIILEYICFMIYEISNPGIYPVN